MKNKIITASEILFWFFAGGTVAVLAIMAFGVK
jgi:hypothetical protein